MREVYGTEAPKRYLPIVHKVILNYPLLSEIVKSTNFMKNIPLGTIIVSEVLNDKITNQGFKKKFIKAMDGRKMADVVTKTYIRINQYIERGHK